MRRLRLTKLHATGNDFLVLADLDDEWDSGALDTSTRALLCDRHLGVGADGLVRVLPGRDGADLTMELTNADGRSAEMSGNGARCLAAVAAEAGLVDGSAFTLATGAGMHRVEHARTPEAVHVRVDMGPVTFETSDIPVSIESPFEIAAAVEGATYRGDAAGMGNPHLVLLLDDLEAVDGVPVARHGPLLERDPRFPKRTNVEFVAVADDRIRMRVWERGVGETLSCGTGACAAAAVARRRGLVGERTMVEVPGGSLVVELGERIWLGGPVVHVAEVEVDIDRLTGRRA